MTNQHTERKRTVAGIALAALVFSGALVFTGELAAQTAEEPLVVFRVRMLQAERAATDKLAADHAGRLKFGPDNMLWVTERTGKRVSRIDPVSGKQSIAITIDEVSAPGGQRVT